MGMGFAPTWLRPVSPLLHKTTLTTGVAGTKIWKLALSDAAKLCLISIILSSYIEINGVLG